MNSMTQKVGLVAVGALLLTGCAAVFVGVGSDIQPRLSPGWDAGAGATAASPGPRRARGCG